MLKIKHKPDDTYINVKDKTCLHENCTTIPNYGKIGTKLAEYCVKHKPDDTYIDVKNKTCLHENCTKRPNYGKIGIKLAEYCKDHKPDDTYIDVKNKTCLHENCTTIPVYGKIGTKLAEFCVKHKPDDTYINAKDKTCLRENCTKQPNYGKIGTKLAEYCVKHKPDDTYINVKDKTCLHENCGTIPSYGKIGTKLAEYCVKHKPDYTYIDVRSKTCKDENCGTQPSYGTIGYSPSHCREHQEKGMIIHPLVKCSLCNTSKKKPATKTTGNKQYFCDKCAPENAIDIHNICAICCSVIVKTDEYICPPCELTTKDGKTIKRKIKELSVKQKLGDSKIDIYLYDKIIPEGCSKKRPDFVIPCDWGYIIIEVDEYQHQRQTYSCECEIVRMKQIFMDIGTQKVLFIRYNPDSYKPSYGNEFSTIDKLDSLVRTVKQYQKEMPEKCLTILYLFYNGYTQLTPEIDIINPYN